MAGEEDAIVRLCEHPDFDQAVLLAAAHFEAKGFRPAIVEKDYFVTEALRSIARVAGDRVIFKGGTSLSKGWDLIDRFSEDIDLFLDPQTIGRTLSPRGVDRELKVLRDAVGMIPSLEPAPREGRTIGGFGRSDVFVYRQRFAGVGEVAGRILLEAGIGSGREPSEKVLIRSIVSTFLEETGGTLGAEDETPFAMRLLHFRRTFVEKLFAIHAKVQLLRREGRPLGTYARHYYDLHQLAGQTEVRDMLATPEYAEIREDYDRISRMYFARDYLPPEGLSFARSDALFPSADLADAISRDYETQCRALCYRPFPAWSEVLSRFEAIRSLL